MSLELLKHCLNYDFYNKNKELLDPEFFPSEVRKIYLAIVEYFSTATTSCSVEDILQYYYSRYPAMTNTEKANVSLVFDNLRQVNISEEAAEIIIRNEKLKLNATKLATIALDIADGKHINLSSLESVLLKLKTDYQGEAKIVEAITDDIDSLMSMGGEVYRWKFCLPNLVDKMNGVGPGIFGIIGARPNAGKTAFVVSLVFHPDGWAKQGAKVLYLGNEEAAFRTKKRGMVCYTGIPEYEWAERKQEVAEKYDEISGNITMFDVVGMSLGSLEEYIAKHQPDIVIIDQLDKIKTSDKFGTKHEELRELYTQTRELSKKYNCAIIGVSQASAEAEGKLYYGFDMLEGSKTGKGAETDFIITIGKQGFDNTKGDDNGMRVANICKNKLTGMECNVKFMLDHKLSRITL